jgi:hypothetical protein
MQTYKTSSINIWKYKLTSTVISIVEMGRSISYFWWFGVLEYLQILDESWTWDPCVNTKIHLFSIYTHLKVILYNVFSAPVFWLPPGHMRSGVEFFSSDVMSVHKNVSDIGTFWSLYFQIWGGCLTYSVPLIVWGKWPFSSVFFTAKHITFI